MSRILYTSLRNRFDLISNKIFAKEGIDILLYNICPRDTDGVHRVSIQSHTSIGEVRSAIDQTKQTCSRTTIFFIPQTYSWGRLCLTRAAFQVIIEGLEVFPYFLEIVAAFGIKTSEDERVVYGWRSCSNSRYCLHEQHELCYNILYMEKHGRKLSNPWSLRQAGVYHQQRNDPGNSTVSRWIFLNLPEQIKLLFQETYESNHDCCIMTLHADLLFAASINWNEYIEYLASELTNPIDIACYSRIDDAIHNGCTISFCDLQELFLFQKLIRRAEEAVTSSIEIAHGCQQHYQLHSRSNQALICRGRCSDLLDVYRADMTRHQHSLERLSKRFQSTLNFLSKTLMFRNEELMQASNRASGKTLGTLLNITDQGKQQQQTLTDLFGNGQADSAMLKALSIVATVCLPASLVANVFQSNLIQTVDSHFVVAPQFWIYIAITLPLMLLTMTWIFYTQRTSRNSVSIQLNGSRIRP